MVDEMTKSVSITMLRNYRGRFVKGAFISTVIFFYFTIIFVHVMHSTLNRKKREKLKKKKKKKTNFLQGHCNLKYVPNFPKNTIKKMKFQWCCKKN